MSRLSHVEKSSFDSLFKFAIFYFVLLTIVVPFCFIFELTSSLWCLSTFAKYYCRVSSFLFNPLTFRSDQYINSPYNFNTMSSRQVMRIKKIIFKGYCLDITPNSQE